MTGPFKALILSPGEKWIWIICISQTVKYYCEMNICYVIVKFTTSMTVNSMFKCKEFNLAKVNERLTCKKAARLAHDPECIYLFKYYFIAV